MPGRATEAAEPSVLLLTTDHAFNSRHRASGRGLLKTRSPVLTKAQPRPGSTVHRETAGIGKHCRTCRSETAGLRPLTGMPQHYRSGQPLAPAKSALMQH